MDAEEVRRIVADAIEQACRDWECPGWWGEMRIPTSPVYVARLLEARIVSQLRAAERAAA